MRSVIFRYDDIVALSGALSETRGSLPLPAGESVGDGEWVLAIFEIGSRRRATAAAARGVRAAGDTHLEFERRDWERLASFVAARSEHMRAAKPSSSTGRTSSARLPVAAPSAPPPPSTGRGARSLTDKLSQSGGHRALSQTGSHRALSQTGSNPAASSTTTSDAPPRSRRFDDIPPSSALESTRIPFGARVLVIDDGSGGDELRAMLSEMGLVVELVSTIKRATDRMNVQPFDAIVLDLHASDSRMFVGGLRNDARPATSEIPVLFLSSRPTSRDVVDAFAAGGDDFLPKPFRTPELAARIFGLLRRARLANVGSR